MKKIFSAFISISILFSFIPVSSVSADDSYFIVTAYYSPLPDQEYYITGNYEDELILNGKGIAGASGKFVFSGMLAAPGKYSFGTKIYLDGLGIWAVEDRGGAIVPAGQRGYSYDRIDVWMGYGDEGLLRANFWGKRKVYWYVIDSGNTTTLDYMNVPAPSWATTGLQKVWSTQSNYIDITYIPSANNTEKLQENVDIFNTSLAQWSDGSLITQMQDIFIELWYLDENSGIYDDATISAVYDFQIEYEIVASEQDIGAGSYGPKTRSKLQEIYQAYINEKQEYEEFLKEIEDIQEKSSQKASQYIESLGVPRYGDISYEVRELQNIFTDLWYFEYKDTAIFGDITKTAILNYQLDTEIISGSDMIWAGVFWPKTREQLTQDYASMYFEQQLIENELEEAYQEYISSNLSI